MLSAVTLALVMLNVFYFKGAIKSIIQSVIMLSVVMQNVAAFWLQVRFSKIIHDE